MAEFKGMSADGMILQRRYRASWNAAGMKVRNTLQKQLPWETKNLALVEHFCCNGIFSRDNMYPHVNMREREALESE